MTSKKTIFVYADWQSLNEPNLMGYLHSELLRGKEIFSFEYSTQWLTSENNLILDPQLAFYQGLQYLQNEKKSNFGLFLDSSPDRWGRLLMRRREAAYARKENRNEQPLFETDYLLGVYDSYRMGGLRFKSEEKGDFLSNDKKLAIPPWSTIRTLEEISLRLEQDDVIKDPHYLEWLNMIIAPGSSLGGARPKAGILDENGDLWLAKFPSRFDSEDVGAWEYIVHEIATSAGIITAPASICAYSSRYHTFLTKRFDRTPDGKRIHFASAMTMLGYLDGDNAEIGVSYLEIAEFIMRHGAHPQRDLEQLWRRIVFNICVSNTDDHLRNHGFLLTPEGWILSPAYDINPVATGVGLSINISESDNSLDLNLALEVSDYFRLSYAQAKEIISQVKDKVSSWNVLAKKHNISNDEIELKSNAFRHST